jgi:hypothetical protein
MAETDSFETSPKNLALRIRASETKSSNHHKTEEFSNQCQEYGLLFWRLGQGAILALW